MCPRCSSKRSLRHHRHRGRGKGGTNEAESQACDVGARRLEIENAAPFFGQKRGGGQVHLSIDEVDPAVQQEAQNEPRVTP